MLGLGGLEDLGFRLEGLGFRGFGGFRVQCSGFKGFGLEGPGRNRFVEASLVPSCTPEAKNHAITLMPASYNVL